MTTVTNEKQNHARRTDSPTAKRHAVGVLAFLPLVVACSGGLGSGDGPPEKVGSTASALSVSDFMNSIPDAPVMTTMSGTRELLVVCMDKRIPDPMPSLADVQTVAGYVQAYFRENSGGRLTINNLMYRGCGGNTGSYVASTVDPPPPQQWTEALNQAVASGFNFRAYDTNGDNHLTGDELGIAVVRQQSTAYEDYGTERVANFADSAGAMTAVIADIYLKPGVAPIKWGIISHEMMHAYANAADLYGDGLLPWRAGPYSLMDNHRLASHLDPVHKLKYGWATPTVRSLAPVTFSLGPVESTGAITILADSHGSSEYFVIENRWRWAGTFDANLPQDGVLVWRVVEDRNLAAIYSHWDYQQWQPNPTGITERWGWQLLTPAPLQLGQVFDLPWLEGETGFQLGVVGQNGGTATIAVDEPNVGPIFGFEDGTKWIGQGVPLSTVSNPKTQGSFALRVGSSGYRRMDSVLFSTTALQGITSQMALDVYVPSRPSNRYWLGTVQLYVNCPSANIYNAFVGHVELTGLPLGRFSTLTFRLSPQVVDAMNQQHADFSIGIALNAAPASPDYVLDNLRFTQ